MRERCVDCGNPGVVFVDNIPFCKDCDPVIPDEEWEEIQRAKDDDFLFQMGEWIEEYGGIGWVNLDQAYERARL